MRKHIRIRMAVESAIVRNFGSTRMSFRSLEPAGARRNQFRRNHKITTLDRSRHWRQQCCTVFHVGARPYFHRSPGRLDQNQPQRCPKDDALFDVSIEPSARHVTACRAQRFLSRHLRARCTIACRSEGRTQSSHRFGKPDRDDPSARSARFAYAKRELFKRRLCALLPLPTFVRASDRNDTDNNFALTAQRNRNAEMGDAVEIIHRAIEWTTTIELPA